MNKLDSRIQWSIRNPAGTYRTAALRDYTLSVTDYGQLGYYVIVRNNQTREVAANAQLSRNASGPYSAPVRNAMLVAEQMFNELPELVQVPDAETMAALVADAAAAEADFLAAVRAIDAAL